MDKGDVYIRVIFTYPQVRDYLVPITVWYILYWVCFNLHCGPLYSFVMCGCVCVFCNSMGVCICVGFVMCGCVYVWVFVCVGFVMCGYVCVL